MRQSSSENEKKGSWKWEWVYLIMRIRSPENEKKEYMGMSIFENGEAESWKWGCSKISKVERHKVKRGGVGTRQVHCSINLKTVRSVFLPTNLYFRPPQGAFYIWTPAFSTTLSQYVLTRLPGSLPIFLQRRFKSKVRWIYILIMQTSWNIFEQLDCHLIATLLDEIAIFPQINTCFYQISTTFPSDCHKFATGLPLVKIR